MKAIGKIWSGTSLIVKILVGLVLGALLGLLVPQATFLTILGDLFVGALKGIAPLLVFVLVISSLANATGGIGKRFRMVLVLYLGSTLIAAVIAWNPDSSVMALVSDAWAGFGAVFGPAMLMSLFWKRSNLPGIVAGMISGGAMVFIWKYLVRPMGGAWDLYELAPAFAVALIMIVIVSLVTSAPAKEIVDEFDEVKAM